jgi:competence protein ComEA
MKALLLRVREVLRASPWSKIALRFAAAIAALVVLAWVGRYVAVGGGVPPAAAAVPPPPSSASASLAAMVPAPPPAPEAGAEGPAAAPVAHAARATADDPVYLNEATLDDLRRLPGVGQKRALAILELRTKLGRFRQIEDLLRVKGLGRAALKKLRPLVRIERNDGGAPR